MDDLENMKTMWIELENRLSFLEKENRRMAREVMSNKYKTIQEKLIAKYRLFAIVSGIMIIYSLFFIGFNPEIVEKYRFITLLYWIGFFLFEGSADIYLMFRLDKLDIYHSSVKDISDYAAQNWKLHKIALFIGIPLAIGALVLLLLALDADLFIISGMITGGLVGAAIGLTQLKKFMRYYKLLQTKENEEI